MYTFIWSINCVSSLNHKHELICTIKRGNVICGDATEIIVSSIPRDQTDCLNFRVITCLSYLNWQLVFTTKYLIISSVIYGKLLLINQ